MADEPFALSTILPSFPADGDYDAMCAALRQTERGRQFLDEHARRNRDSDLGASIDASAPENEGGDTQQAPADVLASVERLQDLAWIMREHGLATGTCEQIEILASTILSAPSLCDPGNRRAQKLGEALGHLERYIDSMIVAARARASAPTRSPFEAPASIDAASEPPPLDGADERPAESISGETHSDVSASKEVQPASHPSHGATLPADTAVDGNTQGTMTEATIVRVPTMWEPPAARFPLASSRGPLRDGAVAEAAPADFLLDPVPTALEAGVPAQPEPMIASKPPPQGSTGDVDEELFTPPPGPALHAAPAAPPSAASPSAIAGSVPGASTRNDPLAALNAMSDEEKIALFT